jgi:hypothetical protein
VNPDLIVVIFAPTLGDNDEDRGDSAGEVGTGCVVGPDLILTARHVVEPERRDDRYSLAVAWSPLTPGVDEKLDWIQNDQVHVVWTGKGDLDAALIHCPLPERVHRQNPAILSQARPRSDRRWSSRGFPRVTSRDAVRKPHDFRGGVSSLGARDTRFEVDEDVGTKTSAHWKGVSGMPVFQDGLIVGVVAEVPIDLDTRIFYAVPTCHLIDCDDDDHKFRRLLGWDPRQTYLSKLKALLGKDLQACPNAAGALAGELGIVGSQSSQQCTALAETLLDQPRLDTLFTHAASAQRQCLAVGDRKAAGDVARMVRQLLPPQIEWGVVDQVARLRNDLDCTLIPVPASRATVAEVIMAAVDQRPARFVTPATKRQFPAGTLLLSEPAEGGRDADGSAYSRDLKTDLINLFEAEIGVGKDPRDFERSFTAYLAARFVSKEDRAPKKLVHRINVQLRHDAEAKPATTYYFIVQLPPGTDEMLRQARESALARLRIDFPSLVFLQLDGSDERDDQDYETYAGLAELLINAQDH